MNMEHNPYSPPKAEVIAEVHAAPMVIASKGRRFGTMLIDYVCFFALATVLGFVIGLVFGEKGLAVVESVPEQLFGGTMMLAYYVFFEGIWGRTPGKFVCGTMVVNETGFKPSIGQVLGRSLCRFIPFEPFSCLGERGWHDSIPKTWVVLSRPR